MLVKLSSLQEMAMKLYERHQSGLLSLQEYLHLMIPIRGLMFLGHITVLFNKLHCISKVIGSDRPLLAITDI